MGTKYGGKPQFSNGMGSRFIVAETVIMIVKNTIYQHATPYHTLPSHFIKIQTIQLGVVLKVHVRIFNFQGRRVSTSASDFFF